MNKSTQTKKEIDKLDAIFEFVFDTDSMNTDELDEELITLGYSPTEMTQQIKAIVEETLNLSSEDTQEKTKSIDIDWNNISTDRQRAIGEYKSQRKSAGQFSDQTGAVAWLKQAVAEMEQDQPLFAVEHRNFEELSLADLNSLIQEVEHLRKHRRNNSHETGSGS